MQAIVADHFQQYREQCHFAVSTETCTAILTRNPHRHPDIQICPAGRDPDQLPWVVIEILSKADRLLAQLNRYREYWQLGVTHTVLLYPEEELAFRFEDGSLIQSRFSSLELPTGSVPFDTDALFRQLSDERNTSS